MPSGSNNSITKNECLEIFGPLASATANRTEEKTSAGKLTDEDLTKLQGKLSAKLTQEQTEDLMKIFRKFHKGNSSTLVAEGAVSSK